jgi:hypothetical protein
MRRLRKVGTRSARPKPEFRSANSFSVFANRGTSKQKEGLGDLCFLVTKGCNFSFRFCRVRFGRWLERKLTGTSGYFSPQCMQLLGQLSVLSDALFIERLPGLRNRHHQRNRPASERSNYKLHRVYGLQPLHTSSSAVARGQFRSDLYYRLNVFPILLPALRERREDIPALVTHFVKLFSRRMGKQVDSIPPETMAAFQWYSWPGNIRELQNLVERAVILSQDDVLQNPLHKNQTEVMIPTLHRSRTFYTSKTLDDSDRALILETLEQARWVVGGPHGAAAKLGLKRTTLIALMRRLDISRPIHQEGTDERGIASGTIRREDVHF